MATTEPVEPKLTEISVSYSVGVKANLGNYESADVHLSRTERWNVEGLTADGATALYDARYGEIREELGARIEKEYAEMIGAQGAA